MGPTIVVQGPDDPMDLDEDGFESVRVDVWDVRFMKHVQWFWIEVYPGETLQDLFSQVWKDLAAENMHVRRILYHKGGFHVDAHKK